MVLNMKVAIVGNSNCVFDTGFTLGVRRFVSSVGGEVVNFSLGGSCCGLHIYTLHDNYQELSSADLIILDSLIIDSFHWKRGIIKLGELLSLIDDMYALYSSLPGKVVSVLFPIKKHVLNYAEHRIYKSHMSSAKRYGVDVVDLYSLLKDEGSACDHYFMQPSHIKKDLSCEIGSRLMSICKDLYKGRKPADHINSPYQVIKDQVLCGLESVAVDSSYYSANCYRLDREISLHRFSGKHLVGALHWNKTESSRFVVESDVADDVVHFRSRYAFFEVLNSRRRIKNNTVIRPGRDGEAITQKEAGKERESQEGFPQLIGLLVRDDETVPDRYVGCHVDYTADIKDVIEMISR